MGAHLVVLAFALVSVGCQAASARQAPTTSAAQIAGTPAGTVMTKEYVATVGRLAYIWGWPLVNNYNRAEAVKALPEPGLIGGVLVVP